MRLLAGGWPGARKAFDSATADRVGTVRPVLASTAWPAGPAAYSTNRQVASLFFAPAATQNASLCRMLAAVLSAGIGAMSQVKPLRVRKLAVSARRPRNMASL